MANLESGQRRLAAGEPPFEAPGGSDQDGEVRWLEKVADRNANPSLVRGEREATS